MFESTEAESVAGRGRNFWLLTALGLLTSASIVRHAIQGIRLLSDLGFVYLGLSLLAIIVAWLHYTKLQSGFSKIRAQVDEIPFQLSGDGRTITESWWSASRPTDTGRLVYEKK